MAINGITTRLSDPDYIAELESLLTELQNKVARLEVQNDYLKGRVQ